MRIRRVRKYRPVPAQARAEPAPITRLPKQSVEAKPAVVLVGSRLFSARMHKLLAGEDSLALAADAASAKDALAAIVMHRAELAVMEVNPVNVVSQVMLARTMMDRMPGCGIMLICSAFTTSMARNMWVYGTESWSVLTGASSDNPAQVAEAVSSAVRGMTWVEPGVRRVMATYGPRPKSVEERRLLMLHGDTGGDAMAA